MTKNGRWIDPMKVLRKKSVSDSVLKTFTKYKNVTTTKYKEVEIKNAKENKEKLLSYLKKESIPFTWDGYQQTSMGVKDGKADQTL